MKHYKNILNEEIQDSSWTVYDRYPTLFLLIKKIVEFDSLNEPEILSYGCSSGEEIFSLDDLYIKYGKLTGVDHKSDLILGAKNKLIQRGLSKNNNQINFFTTEDFISTSKKYDFVLALSVFCKWPQMEIAENPNQLYPFSLFSKQINSVSDYVKVGGYIVIHNSNYFFEDTITFQRHFRPFLDKFTNTWEVARFSPQGHLENSRTGHIFFKRIN